MDVLKMIKLQDQGLTAPAVAAQLGESESTVRNVAKKVGSPFPVHPAKNYPCIACRRPKSATLHERTCYGCKERQRRYGIDYIETYSLPGGVTT